MTEIQLLKMLNKKELKCDNLDKEIVSLISYSVSRKHVEYFNWNPSIDDIWEKDAERFCRITECGKQYLIQEKASLRKIWIPVIIDTLLSVAAIAISIIALLKQ